MKLDGKSVLYAAEMGHKHGWDGAQARMGSAQVAIEAIPVPNLPALPATRASWRTRWCGVGDGRCRATRAARRLTSDSRWLGRTPFAHRPPRDQPEIEAGGKIGRGGGLVSQPCKSPARLSGDCPDRSSEILLAPNFPAPDFPMHGEPREGALRRFERFCTFAVRVICTG